MKTAIKIAIPVLLVALVWGWYVHWPWLSTMAGQLKHQDLGAAIDVRYTRFDDGKAVCYYHYVRTPYAVSLERELPGRSLHNSPSWESYNRAKDRLIIKFPHKTSVWVDQTRQVITP